MQVEIDFDVYKALTARREHAGHSYNDVLRELLGLDSIEEPDEPANVLENVTDSLNRPFGMTGFFSRGLHLPDGTLLRARYKQRDYRAKIESGSWRSQEGAVFASASAAAAAITGTNVNGLRFWEAQRPGDKGWRRLELLRDR